MDTRISIEGNIRSGKLTLLRLLQKTETCSVENKQNGPIIFFEPVDEWKNLKLFSKNPKKYALLFQDEIIESLIRQREYSADWIRERSLVSCFLFFTILLDQGYLTSDEWEELHDKILENKHLFPDHIFYLRTTPEKCLERIRKRMVDPRD